MGAFIRGGLSGPAPRHRRVVVYYAFMHGVEARCWFDYRPHQRLTGRWTWGCRRAYATRTPGLWKPDHGRRFTDGSGRAHMSSVGCMLLQELSWSPDNDQPDRFKVNQKNETRAPGPP